MDEGGIDLSALNRLVKSGVLTLVRANLSISSETFVGWESLEWTGSSLSAKASAHSCCN